MYQQQLNISNQYPEECYIDQEAGILKTPCNLYNHSLKIINNTESIKSRAGVTGTDICG
ncbi:hypothetical protein [Candidatus Rickettsia kedanie]|uniref:Uncharacterized protein n=1 Tax=Candidatus Rickettsia kedanie TaxID=3115352 RepID=A0ABP9TTM6_9RICK